MGIHEESHKNEENPKFLRRDVNKGHVRNQNYIEGIVAETMGIDEVLVKDVFNACWDAITDELEHGNTVKLHGKGQFYLSRRSKRIGRNPATGEEYEVPEREAMAFQTSPAYAKRLRDERIRLTSSETDAE